MAAHSPAAAVMVPVALQENQGNWSAWLQHIALAVNQLMGWTNRPRLVALTVDTLPADPLPGEIAFITDSTTLSGMIVGGGTIPALVWYDGDHWERILSS